MLLIKMRNNFILNVTFCLLFSCGGGVLKDSCECELSEREVFLDYKGEYY